MSAHQPGPWSMDKYDNIKDANGERILASGIALAMTGKDSAVMANVRLIAAAPDLLEALETIELALKAKYPAAEILDKNSPIRDGIRAAIAKAKGE